MTIRFACECGQQLAVRDENAGKRVRCTSCSAVVAVPNGTPAPRPAVEEPRAATASTIRFSCDECGKAIQAKAEFVGKKTKCPGCGAVQVIPRDSAAAPAAVQAEKPKPRRLREDDEDEDRREESEEEDRPRRGKKKAAGGGGKRWIVVAACLLLLVGGGFAAWMLFFKGGGASADFNLVPRDAVGFGTMKVSEMLKTDLGKKVIELARKQDDGALKEFEKTTGLTLDDFERVTYVLADPRTNTAWVIVRTGKDYDQKKILEGLKSPPKETASGKDYYFSKDLNVGVSFVDGRTLLLSNPEGFKRCLALTGPKPGPLDESVALASQGKHHTVIGVNVSAAMAANRMMGQADRPVGPAVAGVALAPMQIGRQPGKRQPPGGAGIQGGMPGGQMGGMPGGGMPGGMGAPPQSFYFAANFKDQVECEVGMEFPDQDKAQSTVTQLEQLLKGKDLLLGLIPMPKKEDLFGIEPRQVIDDLKKILDQVKPKQDGKKVIVTMNVDSKIISKYMDQAVAGIGGGGGGGGGGRIRGAASEATAINNFKQIGVATDKTIADADGKMSALTIANPQGQPLLSWRVAILRSMEHSELYKKIHLNERWDSPHNQQFWNQMPKQFELPGHDAGPGMTYIQTFTGPGTPFPPGQPLRYPTGFLDGTSNTILIAEAKTAVNWMAPDSKLDALRPRATLGNHYGKGSLVGMADFAVGFVPLTVTEKTLKDAINPNDSNILGPDWILK